MLYQETMTNPYKKPIPPMEVNLMNLSAKAIQLAHLYFDLIEQQGQGDMTHGYTAEELDRQRTRVHNKFITALREDGVDVEHRASTTDLARKIRNWIPE